MPFADRWQKGDFMYDKYLTQENFEKAVLFVMPNVEKAIQNAKNNIAVIDTVEFELPVAQYMYSEMQKILEKDYESVNYKKLNSTISMKLMARNMKWTCLSSFCDNIIMRKFKPGK